MKKLAAILLIAFAAPAQAQSPNASVAPGAALPRVVAPRTPTFAARPCWFETPKDAGTIRCGTVRVPAASDGKAGSIDLGVVVLKATSATPRPDPLVFVAGGPGSTAIRRPTRWISHPARANRDIVLFDARGSWGSGPFCDSLAEDIAKVYADDLTLAAQNAKVRDLAVTCRSQATSLGIRLSDYKTSDLADDLDAVRRALAYPTWNLLAVSYGNAVAIAELRNHPRGIRSVVLDSVSPNEADWRQQAGANYDFALRRVFDACAADVGCRDRYGDLAKEYSDVLSMLATRPLTVASPRGNFTLNPQDFILAVHRMLYSPKTIALVPLAINRIGQRDTGLITTISETLREAVTSHAYGAHFAIDCQGRGVSALPPRGEEFPITAEYRVVCPALSLANRDARSSGVRRSPVPALVLIGEFDPITPASVSRRVAASLHANVIEFRGQGHGVTGSSDCAVSTMIAFLDNPSAKPIAACADKPLRFAP